MITVNKRPTLRQSTACVIALLSAGALMHYGTAARAQGGTATCQPPQVIPLTGSQPAPKLFVDAPLPEPLASRGVVVIPYCAENMRIAPVFGPGALTVSPRLGHVHVTVDAGPWLWADASGTPIILQGLPPGPHSVLIELVNANHEGVDKRTVRFVVPSRAAARPGS